MSLFDEHDISQVHQELGTNEGDSRKPYVILSSGNHRHLQIKISVALRNGFMVQGGVTSDKGVLYQAVVDTKTLHNPQVVGAQGSLLNE